MLPSEKRLQRSEKTSARTAPRLNKKPSLNPRLIVICFGLTTWSMLLTANNAFVPSLYHQRRPTIPCKLASRSETCSSNKLLELPSRTPVTDINTKHQTNRLGDDSPSFGCLVEESVKQRTPRSTATRNAHYCTKSSDGNGKDNGPEIAPRSTSPIPSINSAPIFGLRPNSPAQYLIATTGVRPMAFSIHNGRLPEGLHLDARNGVIYGKTNELGSFAVTLMAANQAGVATKSMTIQVDEENAVIALTPPRGISTWNSCGDKISAAKVRAMAEAAVQLGLRDYGYTYLNIDDGWQGERKADGTMQPNEKFGDIEKLFVDLHALGFRCGIYGTPWKWSYAYYPGGSADPKPWLLSGKPPIFIPGLFGWRTGLIRFEEQDAAYFSSIGVDFVKWDWYRNDLTSTRRMANALRRQPRDIVYSLSNSAPMKNAKHYQQLSNMVRTTPDIRDVWDCHASRDPFCIGIKEIWRVHERWAPYSGPGHWTDPDMLVVGPVGWGDCGNSTTKNGDPEPLNHLTLDEQLSHMTLWNLWAAPLLIGCDLDKIENVTLDMLCNRGALSINEDSLGCQGKTISRRGDAVVVAKPLANGDVAVGLFNTGQGQRNVSVTFEELGLKCEGARSIYDVWADRDLRASTGLSWKIREHSAKLFRVSGALSPPQ